MALDRQMDLDQRELDLLRWIARDQYAQYGECYGDTLQGLLSKGLVRIHEGREHQEHFITQGDGPMYRAVSVTDNGMMLLVLYTTNGRPQ